MLRVCRAVNVIRAGCCRCPNTLMVSGQDADMVLLTLLTTLEAEGWSLDASARRICAACSKADENRAWGLVLLRTGARRA